MGRVEKGGWAGVGGIGPSSNVGLEVEGRKGMGAGAPLGSVAERLGGENLGEKLLPQAQVSHTAHKLLLPTTHKFSILSLTQLPSSPDNFHLQKANLF